jgi:hypothetical protein
MAARAAAVVALVLVGLASTATAQMESCNEELPPVLVGNYSGLACQPVWNNFVLRVCALPLPMFALDQFNFHAPCSFSVLLFVHNLRHAIT